MQYHLAMTKNHRSRGDKYSLQVPVRLTERLKRSYKIDCEMFQAESVRDAAFGCDWVGTPIPFQRCLMLIIAIANKVFQLTAGKFVPVSNVTMLNVRSINIRHYFVMCQPPLASQAFSVLSVPCHTQTLHTR